MKNMYLLILFSMFWINSGASTGQAPWEKYKTNRCVSYKEAVNFYHELAAKNKNCRVFSYGNTDCGKPLELFVINGKGKFSPEEIKKDGDLIILINNGIHPGEPDGIDASIILTHDLLTGKLKLPEHITIAIIPVYNIDGSLNTAKFSREGQNGPEEPGFRGNARNLDLNRDFIKCDSENAKSFTRLYRTWDPDVFIDTHVSDGADYQYVMTLIDSQKDKLSPAINKTMSSEVKPMLYDKMKAEGFEMCPYVNVFGESPDKGMAAFLETPRFATGYAALYNAFPFVTETHMLKPYPQRVEATYAFLKTALSTCATLKTSILAARKQAKADVIKQQKFTVEWVLDTTIVDSISFKGYEAMKKKSEVTGLDRMYFSHEHPYTKMIPFQSTFKSQTEIEKPIAYIIPQAWKEVIERMQLNKIKMTRLKNDSTITSEIYYIRNYNTGKNPYEGHYVHSSVKVEKVKQDVHYFAGDYVIETNQESNRYIIETLEPQATDAFFNWNFFDGILQQKEWFSDYIFEDEAAEILNNDAALKSDFEAKKASDKAFAGDSWAMLTYIFQHSAWYEKGHLRYPVGRIMGMGQMQK